MKLNEALEKAYKELKTADFSVSVYIFVRETRIFDFGISEELCSDRLYIKREDVFSNDWEVHVDKVDMEVFK